MLENVHGGDIYSYESENIIDFSVNVNPLKTPESILTAAGESLKHMDRYPDMFSRKLRKAIGEKEQVQEDYIICGNGAADLIYRFVSAVKPKKALLVAPSFLEYARALEMVECQIIYYMLDTTTFQLQRDFLDHITEDLDMVCICNPNNPTGKLIEKELLNDICEVCKKHGVRLLVDECFNEFVAESEQHSLLSYARNEKHIFLLKAFTKMYGMAGIRLGYGICRDEKLLEKMYHCGCPWNVSGMAQAAGIAAIKEQTFVQQTRDYIRKEKKKLYQALEELQITYWESDANYIFLKEKEGLKEALLSQGILIRDCSNYKGLSWGYYRIAIKSPKENQALIQALEQVL